MKVQGVTIKTPSDLGWGLSDLSSEESGRTLDGKSHKDIITQIVKLNPVWNNLSGEEASAILQAVCPYAYRNVTYIDPQTNTEVTKSFYTGDKSASVHTYALGLTRYSTVSFNFIEE